MSREEVLKKVRGFGFASEARTPISSKWTEVVAALDAFEAETRRKALEWQPIETAPKGGREVILFYQNRAHKARTVMACWLTEEHAQEIDQEGVGLEEGWYERIDNWPDYTGIRTALADGSDLFRDEVEALLRDHDDLQQQLERKSDAIQRLWAERDALMETVCDEMDENLRLRELGGAKPDENITAMTERVIAERDALADELAKRNESPSDRLHNLCRGIEEEADGSAFSREEWERIDAENLALAARVQALVDGAALKRAIGA